jgi:ketosteroid isomerase-like protein
MQFPYQARFRIRFQYKEEKVMFKKSLCIIVALLLTLALAPGAAAQAASIEDLLTEYYEVLNAALASGDTSELIEWFAEDATMSVPALAPQPVTGKDLIEAAMLPGMLGAVGGATIETLLVEIDGNTATVYNMYTGGAQGDFPIQEIIEFNAEGKIQTYTANVGVTLPEAAAETASIEDLLTEYYEVLNAALASGDTSELIEWFAEDATMSVPALAPQPVTGKDLIEAAMLPGMLGAVGGATIETLLVEIDGNTATVYNMYTGGAQGDFPIQEIIEFNAEGKIQTYTVNVGVTPPAAAAETTAAEPTTLPQSGGAAGSLLPALLVVGGGALAALGRRLKAR